VFKSNQMSITDSSTDRSAAGLTRREAFGYAWMASLAAVAAAAAWVSQAFARPEPQPGVSGGLFTLPLAALPPVDASPFNEPAGRFWLVNTPAGALGLRKACTHLECLCEWDGDAREFVCPCHGSRFGEDGRHVEGPAPRGLDRFPISLRAASGAMLAQTDALTGAPLPLGVAGEAENLVLVIDTGVRIQGPPA
jgi:cytochrome b6-f complex iron-sulfur subunit